jgi:GNAT superfamily N-acetyltransferase
MPNYTIELETDPNVDDVHAIYDGLTAFNHQHAPRDHYQPLVLALRDGTGKVIGGLVGETYWEWLHVDALWLDESVRGLTFGTKLLQMAEQEAVRRGCRHVHLDTMSFQAQPFYEKLGYTVFGVLDDLPEGSQRIFLKKDLVEDHGSSTISQPSA